MAEGSRIGEISRARLLHVVGGLLGIGAFSLPWVSMSALGARISLTGWDIVGVAIQTSSGAPGLAGTATLGLVVTLVGLLALLVASLVALARPYGGPVMLFGSTVGSMGVTIMSFSMMPRVFNLLFGLDYGALVAILAATIATVGLLLHRAESRGQEKSGAPAPELPGGSG